LLFPYSCAFSGFYRSSISFGIPKVKALLDSLYKHFVNPLLIYICKSQQEYKNFASQKSDYDRYYITNGFEVNSYEENSSFMSISLDKNISVEFITRLVFLFSNPFYDVVLYSDSNFYDEKICKTLLEDLVDYKCIDNVIAVTREYVALNGFNFNIEAKKVLFKDPLVLAEKLSLAMSEMPVEQEYFIEAIKELIPNMFFVIDSDFDSEEKELIKIFTDTNMNLEYRDRKMNVFWMKHKENNPAIIFSKESLQDYNFMIKRTDGLNFYIYM